MMSLALALALQDPEWLACAEKARERARRDQRPLLVVQYDTG